MDAGVDLTDGVLRVAAGAGPGADAGVFLHGRLVLFLTGPAAARLVALARRALCPDPPAGAWADLYGFVALHARPGAV